MRRSGQKRSPKSTVPRGEPEPIAPGEIQSITFRGSRITLDYVENNPKEPWELFIPYKSQGGGQWKRFCLFVDAIKEQRKLKKKGY
jgi:hypothetical protein